MNKNGGKMEQESQKINQNIETKEEVVDKLTFDNQGNMRKNNRAYRRDQKRLWESTMQGKKLRYFTKKKNKHTKASKKQERQNRKKGRR